jgi:hypothetical protein
MAMSGQKKTGTPGSTAVALGSQQINGALMVKALLANTGNVLVGDSTTSTTVGMELDAGEVIIFSYVGDLSSIYIASTENAEGVAWLALGVM